MCVEEVNLNMLLECLDIQGVPKNVIMFFYHTPKGIAKLLGTKVKLVLKNVKMHNVTYFTVF